MTKILRGEAIRFAGNPFLDAEALIHETDAAIVLQDGQIAEQGSHETLLARGGLYAGFWQRQSGGMIGIQAAE